MKITLHSINNVLVPFRAQKAYLFKIKLNAIFSMQPILAEAQPVMKWAPRAKNVFQERDQMAQGIYNMNQRLK